jgi:uncharacterized protein YuzE
MAEIEYLILADYVRQDAGMTHIMGAGLDTITLPQDRAVGVRDVGGGMMQLEYDLDVGALYIRLSGQPVASTREAGSNAHVDLAADGSLVGIEVISFSQPWPLEEILREHAVPQDELRQVWAYFGPQQPAASPPSEPVELAAVPAGLPVEHTPVLTTV